MMSTDEIKVVDTVRECEMIDEPTRKSLRIGEVTLECMVGDIAAQPEMDRIRAMAHADPPYEMNISTALERYTEQVTRQVARKADSKEGRSHE